jgi:hypothetical protein
LLHGALLG